jgi:hypothetical protein
MLIWPGQPLNTATHAIQQFDASMPPWRMYGGGNISMLPPNSGEQHVLNAAAFKSLFGPTKPVELLEPC